MILDISGFLHCNLFRRFFNFAISCISSCCRWRSWTQLQSGGDPWRSLVMQWAKMLLRIWLSCQQRRFFWRGPGQLAQSKKLRRELILQASEMHHLLSAGHVERRVITGPPSVPSRNWLQQRALLLEVRSLQWMMTWEVWLDLLEQPVQKDHTFPHLGEEEPVLMMVIVCVGGEMTTPFGSQTYQRIPVNRIFRSCSDPLVPFPASTLLLTEKLDSVAVLHSSILSAGGSSHIFFHVFWRINPN